MKKLNLVLLALLTPSSLVFATRDWIKLEGPTKLVAAFAAGGVVTYAAIKAYNIQAKKAWLKETKQTDGQLGQSNGQRGDQQ